MKVADVFRACVLAMRDGARIERTRGDKEFHFQNWFAKRLDESGLAYQAGGRNSYPDFTLVEHPEGFELKGLAHPGRDKSFDSNSQLPFGEHNGRQIWYVFGRYPAGEADEFPVYDLVIFHGSFLSTVHDYSHKNKSFRGFGTYGDILVRDRKMYVLPTPYALAGGTTGQRTVIVPADTVMPNDMFIVGDLIRREVDRSVVSYTFDLRTNSLTTQTVPNPNAGKEHHFRAYRLMGDPELPVTMMV